MFFVGGTASLIAIIAGIVMLTKHNLGMGISLIVGGIILVLITHVIMRTKKSRYQNRGEKEATSWLPSCFGCDVPEIPDCGDLPGCDMPDCDVPDCGGPDCGGIS